MSRRSPPPGRKSLACIGRPAVGGSSRANRLIATRSCGAFGGAVRVVCFGTTQADDAGHDQYRTDQVMQGQRLVQQPGRQQQHADHFQVRSGECWADRRMAQQAHPGEEGTDVAEDGAVHPRLRQHAQQPRAVGLDRQRRIARILEAQLGQRIEGHQQRETDHIQAPHDPAPTTATPAVTSSMPVTRSGVSFSRNRKRPAIISATMLIEPSSTPLDSGTSDRNAIQATNSST
ncbi:hypothetical protein G6F57_013764 [Rhizopus arrhizus]|nr:hypothetical protein G6F57_013764 [Rhizopus arrhizus]